MVAAVLEAAARIVAEGNFLSTSTNAIARRAGVSIGSLYQYFPDKLALLEALREQHLRQLWIAMGDACVEASSLPWPAALRHVVAAAAAHNQSHCALIRLMLRELPSQYPAERLAVARSSLEHQLRRFFEIHRDSITVEVDQAVFMMPALGRGLFVALAAERPEALASDRLVEEATLTLQRCLAP